MDTLRRVKLIKQLSAVNSLGDVIHTEASREVYGVVTSSSQTEWFTAHRDDINSVYQLVIYSFEYDGETVVEMDGQRFGIYRTYERSIDKIELYLEKKAGVEDAE